MQWAGGEVESNRRLPRSRCKPCEVAKKIAKTLLDALAQTAVTEVKKNGMFVAPGIGRLVRADRKARMGRNPATGRWTNGVAGQSLEEGIGVTRGSTNLAAVAEEQRRRYRAEVLEWMAWERLSTVEEASKRLVISLSALKSMMSDRGKRRYSEENADANPRNQPRKTSWSPVIRPNQAAREQNRCHAIRSEGQ